MSPRQTRRVEVTIDDERGVFMISVAAELADMHPQTLRIYEAKGLIEPKRSPKNTRLYSQRDVELLRRIQRMTTEEGLNLAGVVTVLEMEREVAAMRSEMKRIRARSRELERRLVAEMARNGSRENVEIVPYGAYESSIPPTRRMLRIQVERPTTRSRKESL